MLYKRKTNKYITRVFMFFLSLLICLLCVEFAIYYVYRNPSVLVLLPDKIYIYLKNSYMVNEMKYIQYDENCAVYNNQLGYKLKPGECTFSGIEFNNTYRINSMGLRDDEQSLVGPDIIVVGDSFAMGWGVEDNETFSSLIENKTDFKILNAAISSYGTVREMKILENLDLSNLQYLIIQYCLNDYEENRSFIENNMKHDPMQRHTYLNAQIQHLSNNKYYFGKYVFLIFKSFFINNTIENDKTLELETKYFINILRHYVDELELKDITLIIFGTCADDRFINNIDKELQPMNSRISSNNVKTFTPKWKQYYSFNLDPHYTPKGHKNLADELIEQIEKN